MGDEGVTVDEVVLLPGPDAIVAPAWVPWRERIRPGDLSPGDVLPVDEDDPRLVPAYLAGDPGDSAPRDTDEVRQVNGAGFGVEREMKESGEKFLNPLRTTDILSDRGTLPGLHRSADVTLKRGVIG